MNTKTFSRLSGRVSFSARRSVALVLAGAILATSMANGAAPAANTVINAQATASYLDGNGTSQIATSNTVQTTVQQVGAFALTAGSGYANANGSSSTGSSKSGGPGATITVPYALNNTGNGSDGFTLTVADLVNSGNTFTKIDVFSDQSDGNGIADNTTTLLTANAGTSTAQLTIPAGGSYKFVVVYTIPSAASAAWVGKATVTALAAIGTIGYTSQTQVVNDTIAVATGAAFSATNSLGAPLVAAAPSTPSVSTNNGWGATPSSGPRGTATTYTINYTNNGAAAGVLYLKDVLPIGFSFVTGSAVWSSQPGVALVATAASGVANNTGIDFIVSGNSVEAVMPNIAAGASGSLSFKVLVGSTAAIGTSQTGNTVTYSLENCGATLSSVATVANASGGTGCSPSATAVTSATAFTVLASYGVRINDLDVTAGQANGTADTVTQTQVVPGGSVKFTLPVTNAGDASDTYKLSTSNGSGGTAIALANRFPAGTTFNWFAADGVTPLQNTSGSTGVDTGPIAAGATANIVLLVTVPATTTVSNTANLQVIAVATSVGDITKLDGGKVVVTRVIGGLVDLTASASGTVADIGPGSATVVQTISVTAGGTGNSTTSSASAAGNAVFDLFVNNADSGTLTFDLLASQTSTFPGNLPAGWNVKFYSDAGLTTQITQVVSLTTGTQVRVYAVVTPAAASASITGQDVYFKVQSVGNGSSGGVISDYLHNKVNVDAVSSRSFTLSAANNGQLSPGGAVSFTHAVTSTGTLTCGGSTGYLNITATLPSAERSAGWSTALYLDNGTTVGSIDSGDTLITNGQLATLATGQSVPLIVRMFAPNGATLNSSGVVTITVSDPDPAPNCGTQTLTDTATVTSGQISVSKLQIKDATCLGTAVPISAASISAKPGECVIYKVVATNNGSSGTNNVSVNGVVPAYTTYATNQPGLQCASSNLTGTAVAFSQSGGTLACGSASNALAPSGTITLQYAVKVNN